MKPREQFTQPITGKVSELYDVFVDWPGRLSRELPGLELRLAGARRVLDVGCGTGRHVQALLERGYDAHGADASEEMLAQGRSLGIARERLHLWRLGDEPAPSVGAAAPFDAVIALGNVWPMLVEPCDLAAGARALQRIMRPGATLVLGLKAFGLRERSDPYLPLVKRTHEGRALWFVRFVDFDVPQPAAHAVCDLHLSILRGDASDEREALVHRATRVRSWTADELLRWLAEAGFADGSVSGRMDDPRAPVRGEDVFVGARTAKP